MTITLYGNSGSSSFAAHVALREAGADFAYVPLDLRRGAQRDPEFLKLNPNARVPVLVDGDLTLFEAAAICLHVADRFPEARLAPPVGTAQRAQLYKWLVWLTNTLQSDLLIHIFAGRYGAETADDKARFRAAVDARIQKHFDLVEAELAKGGGPFLLGADYGVADAYLLMLTRWSRRLTRSGWARPHVARLCRETLKRPAVRATLEAEGLDAAELETPPG